MWKIVVRATLNPGGGGVVNKTSVQPASNCRDAIWDLVVKLIKKFAELTKLAMLLKHSHKFQHLIERKNAYVTLSCVSSYWKLGL